MYSDTTGQNRANKRLTALTELKTLLRHPLQNKNAKSSHLQREHPPVNMQLSVFSSTQ